MSLIIIFLVNEACRFRHDNAKRRLVKSGSGSLEGRVMQQTDTFHFHFVAHNVEKTYNTMCEDTNWKA